MSDVFECSFFLERFENNSVREKPEKPAMLLLSKLT